MTNQQNKYKEIACAFYGDYKRNCVRGMTIDDFFDVWLLTEEGKRLTAEETDPIDRLTSYELLVKISEQLDRLEGRCTVTVSELHTRRIHNRKD